MRDTLGHGNADKAAEYTRYAKRCVETAKTLPDREDRSLHREMAAEWLRLAERLVEEATFSAQPKRRKTSQG
jgi:DNA primase